MLSNLKAIYLRGENFDKAREVLTLLIEAMPDYADEYRQRGIVQMRLGNHRAAKEDLDTYLRLEPNAPEHAERLWRERVELMNSLVQVRYADVSSPL